MKRIKPGFATEQKLPRKIDLAALSMAVSGPNRTRPRVDAFKLPEHPPGVVPSGTPTMAQDTALLASTAWAGNVIASTFSEGLEFLGYPYLAELAQRPEYRVIFETIAGEMTRKWLKFQAVGDDDKNEQIKQLEDEFDRLNVQEQFRRVAEQDGAFGRAHLYLDLGVSEDREELRTPIGDGLNNISKVKIKRGSLKRLTTVEAVWCYPQSYNSNDPLKPDWYNPQSWFVMGKEIHVSRLLLFIGREVPDLLKPAYSFGGLSLSQMAKPYVDNWLNTRQSVNDLIQAFVVWGLKTNLAESLQPGGEALFNRLALFNIARNNKGVFLIDKETEEFFNVTAPLGSLDALQAQAQEHMAAVSRIPIVKLLGIQPAGLNASSEGEIRTFYDSIHEYQTSLFNKNLKRLIHIVMRSLWGYVDPDITFEWNPLWSLDEKAIAEVQEIKARTGGALVDGGIISAEEERTRVAKDPDTPYHGLNPDELPESPEEEGMGMPGPEGVEGLEGLGGEEGPSEPEAGAEEPGFGAEPKAAPKTGFGASKPSSAPKPTSSKPSVHASVGGAKPSRMISSV